MFKRILVPGCVVVSLLCVVSGAGAQDKSAEHAMPDMAEMMKKWLATTTPGPQHKKLDYFAGNWTTVTKMWMDPSAPPVETKGTATMKWVLDGRFMLQESTGEMMMPDASGQMKPRKYQGMGLHGFDVYRGMFIGTWADNLSTTILTMAGMVDPSGKVFTYFGEMDEPMLDIRGRTVKYVTRIVDQDNFVFEVYDLLAGPDHKVFEIAYSRKK